jgi:hypothetical protein
MKNKALILRISWSLLVIAGMWFYLQNPQPAIDFISANYIGIGAAGAVAFVGFSFLTRKQADTTAERDRVDKGITVAGMCLLFVVAFIALAFLVMQNTLHTMQVR